VSKPIDIAQVKEVVARALLRRARAEEAPSAEPFPVDDPSPDGLVGRSPGMLAVYKQIARASASDASVLVTGETGTGKELVARALHRHGARRARPFVPVNCGAFAEGLLESELFGHVRGAFTGALVDHRGVFEQAHLGTLFLDEVGEMTSALQVRLLRVLELGELRPLGGGRVQKVDVRVIAATHRDLERAVREGTFRQDLFYRLNVFPVVLPPLRARREDVPLLAAHILRGIRERTGRSARISAAGLDALEALPWPGNVRELVHLLERLVASVPGGVIEASDLPPPPDRTPGVREEPFFSGLPSLEEMEKRYLMHVLAEVGGNKTRAADVLGIDRRTLYRMAQRFGLDLDDRDG